MHAKSRRLEPVLLGLLSVPGILAHHAIPLDQKERPLEIGIRSHHAR